MRVFKTRQFARWAVRVHLSDTVLLAAARELDRGVVHVRLGACLIKQRIALGKGGKRGGARVFIALKLAHRVIFLYGFAKNQRANITPTELRALKLLSRELTKLSASELRHAVDAGILVELREKKVG